MILKIVALIPIKLNSERLPGKNIKKFHDGTPLIKFIQWACLKSKSIDEVYVYCSSADIQEFVVEGVNFLKRPEYLDGDKVNANDIIKEFIKEVDADVYVLSHSTSPFTKSESIEACIEKVVCGDFDSAFLAKKMKSFLWQDGQALNFDVQNFPRTQDLKAIYSESSGAFVFSMEVFKKHNGRVGVKPYIHEVDEIEGIDIDYMLDFQIANALYKEGICGEN